MAADTRGDVYVADTLNDRVQEFDASGRFVAKWGSFGAGDGQFETPYAVGAGARGDVFVADADNDRVQEFDAAGNFLAEFGSGPA